MTRLLLYNYLNRVRVRFEAACRPSVWSRVAVAPNEPFLVVCVREPQDDLTEIVRTVEHTNQERVRLQCERAPVGDAVARGVFGEAGQRPEVEEDKLPEHAGNVLLAVAELQKPPRHFEGSNGTITVGPPRLSGCRVPKQTPYLAARIPSSSKGQRFTARKNEAQLSRTDMIVVMSEPHVPSTLAFLIIPSCVFGSYDQSVLRAAGRLPFHVIRSVRSRGVPVPSR